MILFKTGFNRIGRTANVLRNMNIAFLCKILNILLSFYVRSVFISMLGKTYLGVNGIFSNILTLLSLSELGFSTAIVYNLYKPLKEKDEVAISSLMAFYKHAYCIIGIVILGIGLCLMPFLDALIKEQPEIKENLLLLYFLNLISVVSTFFYAHKTSLINADQKSYICNIYEQGFHCIQILLQLLILISTKNYLFYLVIQIFCKFMTGAAIARQANKIYPFLKTISPPPLAPSTLSSIKKDVVALFLYRVNRVIIHGTDNILIACLVGNGVQMVGLYSNYTMLAETANMVMGIITGAFTHSLGNLNAENDTKRKEDIFYCLLLISSWLYGYVCSGLFVLSGRFIKEWLGKAYILSAFVVFAEVLQLYIRSVHFAAYTYRITNGLFVQSKYVPLFTSVCNIWLSIWWGKLWGLFGILLATSVARICTIGITDPYFVYKYVFKKKVTSYYFHYAGYLFLTLCATFFAFFAVKVVTLPGWLGFMTSFIVFSLVFNCIYLFAIYRTFQFKIICEKIRGVFSKN